MFKNFEKSDYKNSTYSSRFLEISTGKFFSKLLRKSCSIPKMESSYLPAIITYRNKPNALISLKGNNLS